MSKRTGVVANTLFGLLAQGTTAAFTAVLTLYLVRELGPDGYGLLALAISISAVGVMVSDFGLAPSAGRWAAEAVADRPRLKRVADAALPLKLLGAGVIAAVLFGLSGVIAGLYDEPGLEAPLRWIAVALFFESLYMLYTSTFGAVRRVDLNARLQFFESLLETTASIALVAVGSGVAGAAAGRAAGYATGVVVGVFLLARMIGRPSRQTDPPTRRAIARYARPLLLINGAYTLYAYIDALLIGLFLTARDLGNYSAPIRLVTLITYVGQSVATAVAPRLAGDEPEVDTFVKALRLLIVAQVLLVVPLLAWADPIVNVVLGSEYDDAAAVLRALTPYTFLVGMGPLITMTVTFMGDAARRVPIVLAALVVNVILNLVLLPWIGVLGATIAIAVAFAIYLPAHLRIVRRAFDIDLRPLALTLGRSLLAGAAAAGVLLAISTADEPALWQWGLAAVATPLAYGLVLLGLGEVRPHELRALKAYRPGGR